MCIVLFFHYGFDSILNIYIFSDTWFHNLFYVTDIEPHCQHISCSSFEKENEDLFLQAGKFLQILSKLYSISLLSILQYFLTFHTIQEKRRQFFV